MDKDPLKAGKEVSIKSSGVAMIIYFQFYVPHCVTIFQHVTDLYNQSRQLVWQCQALSSLCDNAFKRSLASCKSNAFSACPYIACMCLTVESRFYTCMYMAYRISTVPGQCNAMGKEKTGMNVTNVIN